MLVYRIFYVIHDISSFFILSMILSLFIRIFFITLLFLFLKIYHLKFKIGGYMLIELADIYPPISIFISIFIFNHCAYIFFAYPKLDPTPLPTLLSTTHSPNPSKPSPQPPISAHNPQQTSTTQPTASQHLKNIKLYKHEKCLKFF